jgi:hypothetical protein
MEQATERARQHAASRRADGAINVETVREARELLAAVGTAGDGTLANADALNALAAILEREDRRCVFRNPSPCLQLLPVAPQPLRGHVLNAHRPCARASSRDVRRLTDDRVAFAVRGDGWS